MTGRKNTVVLLLVLLFGLFYSVPSFARRFGSSRGGFGRSFSRSSRRSGGFFSSRRSRPSRGVRSQTRKRTGADSTLSRKTAQKGKQFSSRSGAVSSYKKNLKTKWKSKPKKRPEYVPRSVNRGGKTYNVIYQNGNYGYMNMLGTFVALRAADMLVTNAMMPRSGYMMGGGGYGGGGYYGGGYGYGGSSGFFTGLLFLGLIVYFALKIKRG